MNKSIIDKIHDQLLEINYSGTISLCGYGEPLLHKDINYIVKSYQMFQMLKLLQMEMFYPVRDYKICTWQMLVRYW